MADTPGGFAVQEVTCDECGESLGYQAADAPVQRELWRHNKCPVRIARELGMTRDAYDTAFSVTAATINGAYPDFPNNIIGDPKQNDVRLLRAGLAASAVLEALATVGFALTQPEKDEQ